MKRSLWYLSLILFGFLFGLFIGQGCSKEEKLKIHIRPQIPDYASEASLPHNNK